VSAWKRIRSGDADFFSNGLSENFFLLRASLGWWESGMKSAGRAGQGRILVCDDEPGIRTTLGQILRDEGYQVDTVPGGLEALSWLTGSDPAHPQPDALLLDIWLPDLDGLEVLSRIRAIPLDLPVIMISGHGNVETAVTAVQSGADDFLQKPLSLERVLLTLQKALERRSLARERDELRRELASRQRGGEVLLGNGPAMSRLREEISRAGPSESRILITGESGVGKELVARALHEASPRAGRPFIEVNGAAIPEELIESELFGHVKGAFTGAAEERKGKWEQADGGTLFLDEVGDMSPRTQAKILRAIQDGRITRVGGTKTISTDVRIIGATNRDLPAMIAAGAFREDLYFRLAVIPIHVPPLAERAEDIPLLVHHFAETVAERRGRRPKTFHPATLEELTRRPWRGNVRELQNLVERVHLMTEGPVIRPEDLPPDGSRRSSPADAPIEWVPGQTLAEARDFFERRVVLRALAEQKGNISRTAERLGLDRTTLHRKMKALEIEPEKE
jgi:two-component system nitrogen regulation response regulator NtrX